MDNRPVSLTLPTTLFALLCLPLVACSSPDLNEPDPACSPGFATEVVEVDYGSQAGFGQASMPDIVLGPPKGAGDLAGSLDVVSLGLGGAITLAFGHPFVDGPGADLIVFENAFFAGGDPASPFAEPATVSVSDDGLTWTSWPCDDATPPYAGCAGVHPVETSTDNGISPFDPDRAGGDVYDLADIGVPSARFVRITGSTKIPTAAGTSGFDLDAVAVLHPSCP